MTSCPRCFDSLDPDLRVYECPGPCDSQPDDVGSAYQGQPVTSFPMRQLPRDGARTWQPPGSMPCAKCQKAATEICPTCHFRLPADWRKGTAVCVGLAGGTKTGKSVYVGVAIKQLEQLLLQLKSRLSFAPGPSAQIYHDVYLAALTGAQLGLQSTRRASDARGGVLNYQSQPLIIELGVVDGQQRYLVFRDTAGEDLEAPDPDTTYLSYLRRADAVFFLFDPTAVPQIRDLLEGLIVIPPQRPLDPEIVLTTVLRIIGPARPPIAMIVSKFDTLQRLDEHADPTWRSIMNHAGAAFQRDPGIYATTYHRPSGLLLHLEIHSLLLALRAQGFVNAMGDPLSKPIHEHRYFAVSALGGAPDGDKVHPHGISPYRCLDPIRWVLARRGFLPTTPAQK